MINWINDRITELKVKYSETEDIKEKINYGAKIKAYYEMIDYINTHNTDESLVIDTIINNVHIRGIELENYKSGFEGISDKLKIIYYGK